jgi:hypothetical protein
MATKSKYGYTIVTAAIFLVTLSGHWAFAWAAYVDEQQAHGQPVEVRGYVLETARDTLENWQSEFLQLVWQVAGLAFLWHVGSPQSKEGDDRKEAKLDLLLERTFGREEAEVLKARLEAQFPK